MVPALGVDPPGAAPPTRPPGLREVHVSASLLDDFLRIAAANTGRGIETCGILAGVLSGGGARGASSGDVDGGSVFTITTLIIPKQRGTADTVAAEAEEEIFEAQDARGLFPLGWVHTHPAQACFLSSVDVHTQCGYQTMLDEAIAAVMAPRDAAGRRCGLFRLSTPEGLALVRACPHRGFHAHPRPASKAGTIYELCGHVYLNPRVAHEVVDLR
jgi:STAM-binding protein